MLLRSLVAMGSAAWLWGCGIAPPGPSAVLLPQVQLTVDFDYGGRVDWDVAPNDVVLYGTTSAGSYDLAFDAGQTVTLTATPTVSGYGFAGWSGACAGSGYQCTLVLGGDARTSAHFAPVY